ncbi:MAG: hypothetical protein U9Q69_01345 [Nanoarchaeota archaeon]|nr:hypothetical protein [Nanoarchaeota archaeon]
MNKVRLLIGEASKRLNIADHLTYVTYPAVKEVKMLYSITENIAGVARNLMDAILRYDRLYKRIGPSVGNFRLEFETFRRKCARRYNIDNRLLRLIIETNRIVATKKESPMAFVRKDKYIICDTNYSRMQSLNLKKVKEYIQMTKELILKTRRIVKC